MSSYPTDPKVEDVRRRIRAAHDASERPTDKAAAKLEAQGKLYEASAEVGKLEAEIRFVVEGRQHRHDDAARTHRTPWHPGARAPS